MTFRQKWLLRAFVLWTFFIMLVLVKNMLVGSNDAWSFRFVHIGIAGVSMVLAALVWPLARIPYIPDRLDRDGDRDGDGEPG